MPGTVVVACKIPNGVILRNFKMEPTQELVMGGASRSLLKSMTVPTLMSH